MSERNYWQRMKRNRMSRRALLRASGRAGVGAAGLALVGCGDDDDDGQAAAQVQQQDQPQQQAMQQQQQTMQQDEQQAEQQAVAAAQQEDQEQQQAAQQAQPAGVDRYGGTLRFSTPAATHDFFDPHRGVFGPTQYWMGFYMNYMIRWASKEGGIIEEDITSLPELPDAETYIFSVDRGARFWDQYPTEGGRNVTASDIVINFDRQIAALDAEGTPTRASADRTRSRRLPSTRRSTSPRSWRAPMVRMRPTSAARSSARSPGSPRQRASRSLAPAGATRLPTSRCRPVPDRTFPSRTTRTSASTWTATPTTGRTPTTVASCRSWTPWSSST